MKKEKPCPDHFYLMNDSATQNFTVCASCGWKLWNPLGTGKDYKSDPSAYAPDYITDEE